MQDNEKPPNTRFWTIDMIGLVALNIVLLVLVIIGCIGIFAGFYPVIAAWLNRVFQV